MTISHYGGGAMIACPEGEQMNRLRRFYEKVPYGQMSHRVAYATSTAALSKLLSAA